MDSPESLGRGALCPSCFPLPGRYAVMQHCWAADPAARPTFGALAGDVECLVATLRGDHYVQLPVAYVNVGPGASDKADMPL